MDLRRESTNKPEGLIMGWGNLWQNKDRSVGVCPHKRLNYFSVPIAPSKSLLQHKFQRAVQDFLYDSSLAFTQSLLLMKPDCVAMSHFRLRHSALFQAQSIPERHRHTFPERFRATFPLPGKHATCHSNYKLCLRNSAAPNSIQNYYSTYREGCSVFASRHDLTIIANKITLITLFNDLKQSSFPVSGLMCQAPEGNHCKLLTFKN